MMHNSVQSATPKNNWLPYLGLMITRSRHHPAQNRHFLRQLGCQFILAQVNLLLLWMEDDLRLWPGYPLQLTVVVRDLDIVESKRLEVLCSDVRGDEETKYEADTCTAQFSQTSAERRTENWLTYWQDQEPQQSNWHHALLEDFKIKNIFVFY